MPTRLHQMVVGTLAELRDKGITLDPVLDWDRLMQLHRLACACAGRDDPWEPHVPDPTLTIKGLTLRKPSYGAAIWLDDCAGVWWAESPVKQSLALIYAMLYGRRPLAMRMMYFKPHAERELAKLSRRIAGPFPEIAEAIEHFAYPGPSTSLMKTDTPGGGVLDPDPPPGVSFVVSCVQEIYGGTTRSWLWDTSKEWTHALLAQYIMRHRASGDSTKPDKDDPKVVAFREYQTAVAELVRVKTEQRAQADKEAAT
jgi:hypothetical protein